MDTTYLLIDGENIDATLGVNILKRFPRADERPRWDRVLHFDPWTYCPTAHGEAVHRKCVASAATNTPATSEVHPVPVPPGTSVHCTANATESDAEEYETETQHNATEEPCEQRTGLFFLNATQRTANTFVQALLAIGWTPVLLTTDQPELKIVDMGIQKTLDAIVADRPGARVILGSHDVDYLPQLTALLDAGHEVAVLCFREYLAMQIAELEERGLKIIDLEYDIDAFNVSLSRVSPVDISEFDPYQYI